mmetsp:Transcript_146256/g.364719  ORF Transcript_146256/g.364719 Transcript_146256/m.364719 type:complete len:411 (-) Transcript_146256:968-2200(-)
MRRELPVEQGRALQEDEASVRGGVEDEGPSWHPHAILRHAHWRVHGVVDVGCSRMPHILMDPREPDDEHAQNVLYGLEVRLLRRSPLGVEPRGALQRGHMRHHVCPPSLHNLISCQSSPAILPVARPETAFDELVVEPLSHEGPVVPTPPPATCVNDGLPRREVRAHVAQVSEALHVHLSQVQGLVPDEVINEAQLLVHRKRGQRELGRVILEEQLEIVVGGLHAAVDEGIQQTAQRVRGVCREGIHGDGLEGCGELQVEVLDVQHQIRHREQRGDQGRLRQPPAGALGLALVVECHLRILEARVHGAVVLQAHHVQTASLLLEGGFTTQGCITGDRPVLLQRCHVDVEQIAVVPQVHGEDGVRHQRPQHLPALGAVLFHQLLDHRDSPHAVGGILDVVRLKVLKAGPSS